MFKFRQIYSYERKLFLGFKHIRLKSINTQSSSKEAVHDRIVKLSEILDCTVFTAKKMISQSADILSLSSDTFTRNSEFIGKHLKLSDIVEFPVIITFNSSLLQHRYFSLTELGCLNITASHIIKFPQILKKTPYALQKEGIIFNVDNFLETYLCWVDSERKSDVKYHLRKMYGDGSSLWNIKSAMNAEFLSSKLNFSLFKAQHMFKSYPPLRTQSISNTNQLLDVLFETFKLPNSKVFFVPSLLSLHHELALKFLSDIPDILGISTIELFNKFPMMLRRPISSIQRIENILKEYNISDTQLMCCPKVINFTPTTLKQRLEGLVHSEEFSLLKSYKKFLWLVYHYSNLEPRLRSLKKHDIPCSISMLTVSKANFNKYLFASQCRTYVKDICFYLAGKFQCTEGEITQKLKEYPNVHGSSLANCSKIIEFLLNNGVSKQQILNGIGVIFYDIEVVKMYFNDMPNQPDCQPFLEWVNHYNLIQLLIYKIELDAGFRGTILYKVKGNSDDFDEPSVDDVPEHSCQVGI